MQQSARLTVPGGPSIACSTAAAIAWDKAWANNLDPSGRAATGVHDDAYKVDESANKVANGATKKPKVEEDKGQVVSAIAWWSGGHALQNFCNPR